MAHDKIKAATRRRMAETGEPYNVARHAVIKEHKQATERATQAASSLPDIIRVERAGEVPARLTATGAERATLDAIASAVEQAGRFSTLVPEWTGAELTAVGNIARMTEPDAVGNIARMVERASRFSTSVPEWTRAEQTAVGNIARAVEQVGTFSVPYRATLDGIASAAEQVERINDTIRGLGWV